MTKFLIFLNLVLAMVIVNLSIGVIDVYFNNREYDVARIVAESEKEFQLSCARHRKELLRQGWILDPRPKLDELIVKLDAKENALNEFVNYVMEGGD